MGDTTVTVNNVPRSIHVPTITAVTMLTASPTTRSPMRTTTNANVARATLVTVSTVKSMSHHVTVFNVQMVLSVKSPPPNTAIKMPSASVPRDTLVTERTVAHLVHVRNNCHPLAECIANGSTYS